MIPFRCSAVAALLIALVVVPPCVARRAEAAPTTRVAERREWQAQSLYASARSQLERRSVEGRRAAIEALERAIALAPSHPEYEMLLARTYLAAGFRRQALKRFEHVAAMAPEDAEARYGLARVWRLDYLKYVDSTSLVRSVDHLRAACRLDSSHVEAWLMLSSLLTVQRQDAEALAAAEHALRGAPGSPDALIAVASASWRTGDVERSDSTFREAIPQLRRNVRERFDDVAPLVTEADTMLYNHLAAPKRAEWARSFWIQHDPDLGTPANEAQLEYFSRVTQAYFLYYDMRHREWDERGEVYVRFGPPPKVDYNPLGVSLHERPIVGSNLSYPVNVLVWTYPELRMSVHLKDRVLSEYYLLERFSDRAPDPVPQPPAAARADLLATPEARALFPVRAPGVRALPMLAHVARFAGDGPPHVLASIETQASPADTLTAQCVVLDSLGREVVRLRSALSPSACLADSFRVADFARDLPPGQYLIGLSAGDRRRRGSVRHDVTIARPDSALALSDVVVTCGVSPAYESSVRLTANPAARVSGDGPLTAYVEIYHLSADPDGQARFELGWSVTSDEKDTRVWAQRLLSPRGSTPTIESYRAETNAGALRRQFVSVPIRTLPNGRYQLEVVVRDLRSGAEVHGFARFIRSGAVPGLH